MTHSRSPSTPSQRENSRGGLCLTLSRFSIGVSSGTLLPICRSAKAPASASVEGPSPAGHLEPTFFSYLHLSGIFSFREVSNGKGRVERQSRDAQLEFLNGLHIAVLPVRPTSGCAWPDSSRGERIFLLFWRSCLWFSYVPECVCCRARQIAPRPPWNIGGLFSAEEQRRKTN